jgi:hypothetical protein
MTHNTYNLFIVSQSNYFVAPNRAEMKASIFRPGTWYVYLGVFERYPVRIQAEGWHEIILEARGLS